MKQLVEDLKILFKTDKRIWAAVSFIAVVLVFWSLTSSWRPPAEVIEERVSKVEIAPQTNAGSLLEGLHESLGSLNQSNESLKKDIDRVTKNIESQQEEIDWNVDQLVSRLSNMSNTLSGITKKVGEKDVERFKTEQRMEKRSKQNR